MQPRRVKLFHTSAFNTHTHTHTSILNPTEAAGIRAERGDATGWQTLTAAAFRTKPVRTRRTSTSRAVNTIHKGDHGELLTSSINKAPDPRSLQPEQKGGKEATLAHPTGQRDKMLAQILEQMWVDPDVLEALSDEQRKILFLKMREEQVRRWKALEENEEREGRNNSSTKPKKASSKQVTWLLSRDGDVSVTIIGEVDEFRSSKVLQNHLNNRLPSDRSNCIQAADLLPGRDAQQLRIKDDAKLPHTDVNQDPGSPINQSSEEENGSADEDPKDPDEDSCSESGGSSENVSVPNLVYRPHFRGDKKLPLKSTQSDTERVTPVNKETAWHKETSENGGHVAQLRKAFAGDTRGKPPACTKPPIPVKPAHLQKRSLVH